MDTGTVELDLPEDDELIESPFKRRVAMVIAVITFLASAVAFLASWAGASEDTFARDAERSAIVAISDQTVASADYYAAFGAFEEAQTLGQRGSLAGSRAFFSPDPAAAAELSDESARWTAAQDELADVSPLLADPRYQESNDRFFPNGYFYDLSKRPNLASLRQQAQQETANGWGDKADRYVTVITFLAVSLSLLGLSLTIGGRVRHLLVAPALVIAGGCLLATGVLAASRVPHTPEAAIERVAEGDRLTLRQQWDQAVAAYSAAIDLRPDYATAYERRASAQFIAGSPQQDQGFISITSPEALQAAIADNERAVAHGGNSPALLGSLGFDYFLDGRYAEAQELTVRAIALNEDLPALWGNLGLILAARGNVEAADTAYARTVELIEQRPEQFERDDLYSAALTDLELLERQFPARADLVDRYKHRLVQALSASNFGEPLTALPAGAAISDAELIFVGEQLQVDYAARALAEGAHLTWVWYERPRADDPWRQRFDLTRFEVWDGRPFYNFSDVPCAGPAEFRVDIYAEGEYLAFAQAVRESSVGLLTEERDDVAGFTVCRPDAWDVTLREPGALTLASPLGGQSLAIRVAPAPRDAAAGDPRAVALATIDSLALDLGLAGGGETVDFDYGFVDGTYREYDRAEGSTVRIWASLGADSVLRTLVGQAPSGDFAPVSALLESMIFTVRET